MANSPFVLPPVDEDGIPISNTMSPEFAEELGLTTPKITSPPDVSAFPHLHEDLSNYIIQGPDKAIAIARNRDQFVGPPTPAVDMVPPGAAAPPAPVPVKTDSNQPTPFGGPPLKDLGDGTVVTQDAGGNPVRIAASALTPEKRSQLLGAESGPPQRAGGGFDPLQMYDGQAHKKALEARKTAYYLEKEAIDTKFANDQRQQDEEFALAKRYQQKHDQLVQDNRQHQEDAQAVMDERMAQVAAIQDKMAKFTFDPDKYVHERSTGGAILDALAMAFFGFAGHADLGMKMLSQKRQAAIDQQKEEYRRLGEQANFANNAYARAREAKMDDRQATMVASQMLLNDQRMALDVVGKKYANGATNAARQAAIAHVDQEYAKGQEELHKTFFNEGIAVANARRQERQFRWDQTRDVAHLQLQGEALEQRRANGKQPLSIPGFVGTAATPDEHKEAIKASVDERKLLPRIDKLINYRTRQGNEFLNRSEIAMAISTARQLKVMFKDHFGLGVMSESDSDLLDAIIADPTKVSWTPATLAVLQQLRDQVVEDTTNTMEAYGFHRASPPTPYIDKEPIAGGR